MSVGCWGVCLLAVWFGHGVDSVLDTDDAVWIAPLDWVGPRLCWFGSSRPLAVRCPLGIHVLLENHHADESIHASLHVQCWKKWEAVHLQEFSWAVKERTFQAPS